MTKKDAQRRLKTATRELQRLEAEVREANALVVKATSALPPHYVDEHRRFAPGQRALIQKLIDRAQKASDQLAAARADVVNARSYAASHAVKKSVHDEAWLTERLDDGKLKRQVRIWQRNDGRYMAEFTIGTVKWQELVSGRTAIEAMQTAKRVLGAR